MTANLLTTGATKAHNQKSEREQYEDQQFMRAFTQITALNCEMAGTKGEIGGVYKRLKDLGWSKKDIEFAKSLKDKDVGQVTADLHRKIRIAKLFGHPLGRQVEMFDTDRAPQEERAYDEGHAAGMLREENSNPYQSNPEASKWQEGYNDGTAQVNKDLADAMDQGNKDLGSPLPDDEDEE